MGPLDSEKCCDEGVHCINMLIHIHVNSNIVMCTSCSLTHPVQRHPRSLDQQVLCDLGKLVGQLNLFPQEVLQYFIQFENF